MIHACLFIIVLERTRASSGSNNYCNFQKVIVIFGEIITSANIGGICNNNEMKMRSELFIGDRITATAHTTVVSSLHS